MSAQTAEQQSPAEDFFHQVREDIDDVPGDELSPKDHLEGGAHAADSHFEDVEVTEAPPKKKSRRTLFIIIGVVLLLTVITVIAAVLLFPAQPKRQPPSPPPVVDAPSQSAEAVQMLDHAASGVEDPMAAASEPVAAAQALAAQATQTTTAPVRAEKQLALGTTTASMSAAAVGGPYATVESVQALAEEVRQLHLSVDALQAKRSEARTPRAPTATAATADQAAAAASRASRSKAAGRDKEKGIATEKAGETRASVAGDASKADFGREPRLILRGVFPPSGADQQAWVVDGDRVVVVSKGDRIRGATVVNVTSDLVKTTLGEIRY